MPDLTTFDDEIVDDDGYPTDAALALIPTWTGTPKALVEDLLEPIFRGYGGIRVTEATNDFGRPVIRVDLVTGGWSGCESAIGALHDGMFWFAWWASSRRGGAYSFEVPATSWAEPMVEWPHTRSDYDLGWAAAAAVVRTALDEVRALPGTPDQALDALHRLELRLTDGPADSR